MSTDLQVPRPVEVPPSVRVHFKRRGEARRYRASLDLVLEKHIDSKTVAEQEAGRLRTGILAVLDNTEAANLTPRVRQMFHLPEPPRAPVAATLTAGQMLKEYLDRHLVRTATHDKQGIPDRRYRAHEDRHARTGASWRSPTGSLWTSRRTRIERLREARRVPTVHRRAKGSNRSGGATAANRDWQLPCGVQVGHPDEAGEDGEPVHLPERAGREAGSGAVPIAPAAARRREKQDLGREGTPHGRVRAPHLRAVVEAALETGCRRGEAAVAAVAPGRTGRPSGGHSPAGKTKTGKPRRVPISTRLLSILEMRETALRTALELADDDPTPGAGRVRERDRRAGGLCEDRLVLGVDRAKIHDLHFHDLRREAGSVWIERGVSIANVQKWLGHANISQTSKYLATTTPANTRRCGGSKRASGRLTPIDTEGGTAPPAVGTIATQSPRKTSTKHRDGTNGMASAEAC